VPGEEQSGIVEENGAGVEKDDVFEPFARTWDEEGERKAGEEGARSGPAGRGREERGRTDTAQGEDSTQEPKRGEWERRESREGGEEGWRRGGERDCASRSSLDSTPTQSACQCSSDASHGYWRARRGAERPGAEGGGEWEGEMGRANILEWVPHSCVFKLTSGAMLLTYLRGEGGRARRLVFAGSSRLRTMFFDAIQVMSHEDEDD
jgi:hypothetical protein